MPLPTRIVIGTRASKLALTQTDMVRTALLGVQADVSIDVERISTAGDRIQDRPLEAIGGKALWVAEIETALRSGRIQLAVHSTKDVPSELPDDMRIAAYLARADARDALVSRAGASLAELPEGARVGTSSPRRASQLRARFPHLQLRDIRGNVDTRLRKLAEGQFDAIILAAAGLSRLGLLDVATQLIPLDDMIPCGGQGAIAIEVHDSNREVVELCESINHKATWLAVTAERAFLQRIGGSCSTPLGVHARVENDALTISAMIGTADGRSMTEHAAGDALDAASLGVRLADSMYEHGGADLLGFDTRHKASIRA